MSITVTKWPQPVAFVKNPVEFELTTDNYITTPATKSQKRLLWSSAPSNGDSFTLAWGEKSVTITFVTGTPDNTGNQIQIPPFTTPGFQVALLTALARNYLIYNDFLLSVTTASGPKYGVQFDAINSGTNYNITVTESLANLTSTSPIVAVDQVTRENFEMIFQVLIDNKVAIELLQTPDTDSKCLFKIQDLLEPYFTNGFQIGFFNFNDDETSGLLKYRIRYAESYGTTPVVYAISEYTNADGILKVLNGGVKQTEFPNLAWFTGWLPVNKKFLTWEPDGKVVSPTQIEQLAFLCASTISTFQIGFTIYYTDGTTGGYSIVYGGYTLAKGALIYFPAGYTESGVSGIADIGKTVSKYTVHLEDVSGTHISETRTYILDRKARPYERIFLYRNSFGIYSTLRTTGEVTSADKNEDSLFEKILPSDYTPYSFETNRGEVLSTDTFSVSTGFFPSIEWKKAFRDFLRSDSVYEYRAGQVLPVILLTKEDHHKESDPLHSSKFEYRYAFTDKAYSNVNNII